MKRTMKILSAGILSAVLLFLVPGIMTAAGAVGVTSAAGVVSVSSGSLNVRSSTGTGGTVVATLSKGTYVTLISKSGSWWRIEYASGSYGYVSDSYITNVWGTSAAKVNTGALNVRGGPGSGYSVRTTLYSGKMLLVLSSNGSGWSRVLYNGTQVGYVNSNYLRTLMAWPVPASGTVNQNFKSGSHLGMDIAPRTAGVAGDSVVAAYTGKAVYSGWLSGYGYVVYVNSYVNGQYIQTRYAHLQSAPSVSAGGTVGTGQSLGKMGATGDATGVHLHFEVRLRSSGGDCVPNAESTPVNPISYVSYSNG